MDEEQRRRAVAALKVYEILAAAMERRQEVFDVVCSSASLEVATSRLRVLLGLGDDDPVQAVLDIGLHRLTEDSRERIASHTEALRRALENVGS